MERDANIECWLTDMDGVLVREYEALPGAAELLEQWRRRDLPYLVLTNNSIYTARDLSARLRNSGLVVPEDRIWTSALATATFLAQQVGGEANAAGTCYVVGETGLTTALHEVGFIMTETDPDYVVVGETRNYSFEAITRAVRLINGGAKFIVTNPDATGPSPEGVMPATGAIASLISKATGRDPYVVGKPNPMMFRSALNRLGAHSMNTAMIGDRMDTDIVAGMEAGMYTVLVMTGVSSQASVADYPFRPNRIIDGVHELVEDPLLRTEPDPDDS
ncbi:HAD-IIA family hydrolase [Nesterenkonia sp. NBAIMH1]|uniref:HAD-IIA family hydrolase n=1 Tax=Nesterenkonia sp. NBAIMH1 TaxID=2600320 RepID=UPI0011B569A8|nr:HAD-IIA family hydrolase [Nesterenkonia sp. NBAIMH1]